LYDMFPIISAANNLQYFFVNQIDNDLDSNFKSIYIGSSFCSKLETPGVDGQFPDDYFQGGAN